MKVIYRTDDGAEFASEKDAMKHEEQERNREKTVLKHNLDIYLSNKSKLKSGILYYDEIHLNDSWKEFLEALPKSRYDLANLDFSKRFAKACAVLEQRALTLKLHQNELKEAKAMISPLNKAIQGHAFDQKISKELLRKPNRTSK